MGMSSPLDRLPPALVFNIQRCSIHDGPGIRTTVFLKGCPLRCPWCHNPESKSPGPELQRFPSRCAGCGACWDACPLEHDGLDRRGALGPVPGCLGCGRCVQACAYDARRIAGRAMTIEQVMAEVLKDRIFYDDSGGGLTVSGGEPLTQPDFLRRLLAACRRQGVHTAVDTCGYAPRDQLLGLAPLADLWLFDLKILDDARHRHFTGVSNRRIVENLVALSQVHGQIWMRIPLVPGFNDRPGDMQAAADLAASLSGVRQVNLLPYHPLGMHKNSGLGTVGFAAPEPPSQDALQAAAAPFRDLGLNVLIGG